MADQSHHGDGHDDHNLMKAFVGVFIALLVLTALSFAIGSSPLMTQLPQAGWAVMMAISCAKAMLVIMIFMHLKWEANWKYVLTIPASIMSIFLLMMLVPDVGNRYSTYSSERLLHSSEEFKGHSADGHKEDGKSDGHDKKKH